MRDEEVKEPEGEETPNLEGKFDELGNKFDRMATAVLQGMEKSSVAPPVEDEVQEEVVDENEAMVKIMLGGQEAVEAHRALVTDLDKRIDRGIEEKTRKSEEQIRGRSIQQQQQRMANELYLKYPDLKNPQSELTKRAEEIMVSKGYTTDIGGVAIATSEAANELGLSGSYSQESPTKERVARSIPRGKTGVDKAEEDEELTDKDKTWMSRFNVPEEGYKKHKKETKGMSFKNRLLPQE